MIDTIFDGECRALPGSNEYGYIANKCGNELSELQGLIDKQLEKFAEYLCYNDKQETIRILTDVMRSQVLYGVTPDRYQIIHRPPWISSALEQYGTLILKFKRAEKDNLDA